MEQSDAINQKRRDYPEQKQKSRKEGHPLDSQ
jgi:hypothetical protein